MRSYALSVLNRTSVDDYSVLGSLGIIVAVSVAIVLDWVRWLFWYMWRDN